MDAGPQVGLGAFGGRRRPFEQGFEAVNHGLVVDENVDGALGNGHEVEKGERLGPLCGLGEAADTRRAVKAVSRAIKDAEARAGEERACLM